jgi:hypothetical protein
MRMDDTVPVDRVLLERITLLAQSIIPDREVVSAMSVETLYDCALQATLVKLRTLIYQERGPDEPIHVTLMVPLTWWDHLKYDLHARWPWLPFKTILTPVEYTITIQPSAWYPKLSEAHGPQFKSVMKLRASRIEGPLLPQVRT